jgi:triosephosphate isomerase
MRRPVIAGNWKMYKTIGEAVDLVNGIKRAVYNIEEADIVVCPPFTALGEVSELVENSNIGLGAQDVFWEKEGAFTGEVSCAMLKDAGCGYVIIGHSERRKLFGETNQGVNKKLKAALKEGLVPIVCVGETLDERKGGKTFDVIRDHVEGALEGLGRQELGRLIIAYEPVWAIGTGVNATADQAEEAHRFIRELLAKACGNELATAVRIQYGGSVKPENIGELMSEEDVDGALVGGASLKADSFVEIIKNSIKAKSALKSKR